MMPPHRLWSDIRRIFVTHSKSVSVQQEIYDRLNRLSHNLEYTLTRYQEWSWSNLGGASDSDDRYRRRRRDELLHGRPELLPYEHVLLGTSQYAEQKVNRSDLKKLLEEAMLVVLLEDDSQSGLSQGVQVECELLQ